MTGLTSKNIEELQALMAELGEPKFRARQVFEWLSRGVRPGEMTNLSKSLREKLAALPYGGATIYQKRVSAKDGTIKYLFALEDGNLVEGVLMRYKYGNTLCVSTQVGCRMGCAFCASTLNGCVRNLEAGEILSFVACAEQDVPCEEGRKRSITNLVLMGSGEPLDNYENVVRFLRLVSAPEGMNISPRNISLSTCGLVPQLRRPFSSSTRAHHPRRAFLAFASVFRSSLRHAHALRTAACGLPAALWRNALPFAISPATAAHKAAVRSALPFRRMRFSGNEGVLIAHAPRIYAIIPIWIAMHFST